MAPEAAVEAQQPRKACKAPVEQSPLVMLTAAELADLACHGAPCRNCGSTNHLGGAAEEGYLSCRQCGEVVGDHGMSSISARAEDTADHGRLLCDQYGPKPTVYRTDTYGENRLYTACEAPETMTFDDRQRISRFRKAEPARAAAALTRSLVLAIRTQLRLTAEPYRWMVIRSALNDEPIRLAHHPQFHAVVRVINAIRSDCSETPESGPPHKYSAPDLSSTVNYVCHRFGIASQVEADRDFPCVTSPGSRRRFNARVAARAARILVPIAHGPTAALPSSVMYVRRGDAVLARTATRSAPYVPSSVVRVRRCRLVGDNPTAQP